MCKAYFFIDFALKHKRYSDAEWALDSILVTKIEEIARGLVNYNAGDVEKIKGKASSDIESILGYVDDAELIHRDNLVLI